MKVFVNNTELAADLWIFDKDGTLVNLDGWGKIMEERLRLIEHRYGKEARKKVEPVLGYKDGNFDIKHILYTTRQETSEECSKILGIDKNEILELFKEADSILNDGIFRPIPGTHEVLSSLMSISTVIILTNDLEKRTERILRELNIPYHRVIGSDTYPYYKPDPRLLTTIMKEYNINDPQRIVVVGDSTHDIELAKSKGAIGIGVLSGVETKEGLRKADFIIESIADIKIKEETR